MGKRRKTVLAARPALRDGNAFLSAGKLTVMALDEREATLAEAAEILRVPEFCADKFVDVVNSCVLRDKSANGPVKKQIKFFPAARNSHASTKKERGATTAKRNLKNSGGKQQISCTRLCAISWRTMRESAKDRWRRSCWRSVPSCHRPWQMSEEVNVTQPSFLSLCWTP